MQAVINNLIQPNTPLNINTISGIKSLIRLMNSRGFTICNVKAEGYFYTSVEGVDLEVCADSRANLKPRSRVEGLLVACSKVYVSDEKDWESLTSAVGLNYKELLIKSQKNGNK